MYSVRTFRQQPALVKHRSQLQEPSPDRCFSPVTIVGTPTRHEFCRRRRFSPDFRFVDLGICHMQLPYRLMEQFLEKYGRVNPLLRVFIGASQVMTSAGDCAFIGNFFLRQDELLTAYVSIHCGAKEDKSGYLKIHRTLST